MAVRSPDVGHASWMNEGACHTQDPDLFFPISATGQSTAQINEALAICHRCRVEAECLRYALSSGVRHGIWGGHTEEERLRMLRSRDR
jgi:WhiB family transcriptional regulator, redox-sensing transcriptional regulator